MRLREGPAKGTLEWRRPNRMTLQNMLKHPLYAGAYAYGRRQVDPRKKQPGRPSTGRVTRPRHAYHVLLKEHVPAYITWAQYEQNLARLEANRARAETIGAVRHGPSLLAGLLVCGRCHCRMQVRYGGPRQLHSYTCNRLATNYGGDYCQYLPGSPSMPSSVSGSSPRSNPRPSRCRWRRRRASSRNGRTSTGCGNSAWSGRPMKRNGPPATTA